MTTKLKNLRLTSVDLVGAGANQEADICLYKSAAGPPAGEPEQNEAERYDEIEEVLGDRFDEITEV